MFRRALTILAVLGALFAIFLANRPVQEEHEPLITGRNHTVLVLTDSHHGLCNAHLAAVSALLESYPSLEVHYGSFPSLESKVERIAENARVQNANAKVQWHRFDPPSIVDEIRSQKGGSSGITTPPGLPGLPAFADMLAFFIAAWSKEAHLKTYQRAVDIIQEVDPAIIILDPWFRPAIDAARNLNRRRAYVSPNALLDNLSIIQPRGAHFWKYPR